jgi:hypothetical protein
MLYKRQAVGANPIWTTKRHGGEMADTRDLKSLALKKRAGSSPARGTNFKIKVAF